MSGSRRCAYTTIASLASALVAGAVITLCGAGALAQAPGDLVTVLGRVSERVQHYYGRAQSIVCVERVR